MRRILLPALLALSLFIYCSKKESFIDVHGLILTEEVELNPSGYAPLTGVINLSTREAVKVRVDVPGINGIQNVSHVFDQPQTQHRIPILGLYAGTSNIVELSFLDANNSEIGSKEYVFETEALIPEMPVVEINTTNPAVQVPGWTFVSYFGHNGNVNPQRPFIFDGNGDIRWYLDFTDHPDLSGLFYDNGMERLQNGNLFFGDGATGRIYEINMLGEVLNTWSLHGYGFHHQIVEKPNGNFVVTVNDNSISTIEDVIIEIDRTSGSIVNTWDLNVSLDNQRRGWPTDIANLDVDWFHANAVWYDESDNTIIVSGRTQGVVKLDENNNVVWILAPHNDWVTSGGGDDLTQYLLQPLDSNDQLITDPDILNGVSNHPDFEWAWYQHSSKTKADGNLILFDNGDNRNFSATGFNAAGAYSRAVEYEIDTQNMTIKQVWDYGKNRGNESYSRIVSEVDYSEEFDHFFFAPGAVLFNGENYGKVVEIDRATKNVIFEATIYPPIPVFNITFHRTERLFIYP